jgi:hypothetical protein
VLAAGVVYSTLITEPKRRRRWSEDQKLALLAEAFVPAGNVTKTARRAEATRARCTGGGAIHLDVRSSKAARWR